MVDTAWSSLSPLKIPSTLFTMKYLNKVYLASSSPRRRELLQQIGVEYQLVENSVDESLIQGESAEEYVTRLAIEKAKSGQNIVNDGVVLGADTAVVINGKILGKPKDRDDFIRMFQRLSGHTHQVMSGIALASVDGNIEHRISISHVTFRQLSDDEIINYWETGEPVDKAGGYGIQGYAAAYIRHLDGSYSGVMGLPLFEVMELLTVAVNW
jgi:septum formation protein